MIITDLANVVCTEDPTGFVGREVKMKMILVVLVTTLMIVGLSTAGFAQTQSTSAGQGTVEKKMEPAGKAMVFTGKVVSINETDHALVVKGKQGEKTFDVSNVTIGATKPGYTVHVRYTEKDGKLVASSISGSKKTVAEHNTKTEMKKTSMNGPSLGYDPYRGYDPNFYGVDPYNHRG
jgi:hypothetical protein